MALALPAAPSAFSRQWPFLLERSHREDPVRDLALDVEVAQRAEADHDARGRRDQVGAALRVEQVLGEQPVGHQQQQDRNCLLSIRRFYRLLRRDLP